ELSELRVDGGPVKNNFLMQFQADMLQASINRSPIQEASAFGAYLMSGFAMKRWKKLSEAEELRTTNDYISPVMAKEKVDTLHAEWQKAVKRTIMK
ncbi:MAG: glycerol kinase, partial [Bacteroidales bacterium]|nr:glycerol kinase [Bacteroidales bacterium]